ncbi:MAG: T9SS type A sorting domain-containing protein, partial [bacterium]
GPNTGSGLSASDIIFYVNGINGNNGNLGAAPKAAQIGINNTVFANFYVPHGTLWLKQGTEAAGAFIGKDVIIGEGVQLTLDSFFETTGASTSNIQAFTEIGSKSPASSSPLNSPNTFLLEQNYPNPFNPSTEIRFALPEASRVTVKIFSMLGENVRTLADGEFAAGAYALRWNAQNDRGEKVPSGVYFYQLVTSRYKETKRMILAK